MSLSQRGLTFFSSKLMDQQAELLIAEWKEKVTSIFNINYILTQQFYDL